MAWLDGSALLAGVTDGSRVVARPRPPPVQHLLGLLGEFAEGHADLLIDLPTLASHPDRDQLLRLAFPAVFPVHATGPASNPAPFAQMVADLSKRILTWSDRRIQVLDELPAAGPTRRGRQPILVRRQAILEPILRAHAGEGLPRAAGASLFRAPIGRPSGVGHLDVVLQKPMEAADVVLVFRLLPNGEDRRPLGLGQPGVLAPSSMEYGLLTAREAAQRLGLSRATLYQWLAASDAGTLVIRGQPITTTISRPGPRGRAASESKSGWSPPPPALMVESPFGRTPEQFRHHLDRAAPPAGPVAREHPVGKRVPAG